jgi:outer membrane protein OmpA-like peptidoglycan-associated protein
MKLHKILLLAACIAIPAGVQAQPISGWYVGAGVGINQLLDANLKGVQGRTEMHSNIGLAALGSVGYGFGGGVRAEIEGNYRTQHSHNTPGGLSGTSYSFGPMLNVLYDFNAYGMINPYAGIGVGAQWYHIPARGSSEARLAAQGIVGVAYPMSSPGLAVTVEARALTSIGDQKFRNGSLNNPTNISGLVGLRYSFGAPPAPAATMVSNTTPAPAGKAEDARTYLVFFDWDQTDLTSRARQIIADAAGATSRLAVTRIEVAGHADSSGTPPYNQGLSLRRGQVVAAEMVRQGVKKEAISVTAFGDTRPLVQTAPGGREPQNRRVEIVLK